MPISARGLMWSEQVLCVVARRPPAVSLERTGRTGTLRQTIQQAFTAESSKRESILHHEPHEYRDVTPIGCGRRFHDQGMVSQGALRLIAERGGHK